MEKRPFYLVAHRCIDGDRTVEMIKQGANAIEVDVRHADGVFYAKHDWPADGTKLSDFFEDLCEKIKQEPDELSRFSLIIFDCKETDFDVNELLDLVREKLTTVIHGVSVVVSIAKYKDRSFFDQVRLSEMEAVSIAEADRVMEVQTYFKEKEIPHYCYGNGAFTTPASANPTLNQAISLAVAGDSFSLVYVWTLTSKASMREYISAGVDGIFVDSVADLNAVLDEPNYRDVVFRPDRNFKPFGGSRMPSYILAITTGREVGAGTDANLTFELTGENGTLTRTVDSNPKGMFEGGSDDIVVLSGESLGEILSLQVSRDDSGNAPNWFLRNIAVVGPEIHKPIQFEFNQFIPTSGITKKPSAITYELTVQTSDVKMAGTDAQLTFELTGIKDGEKKLVKTTVDANPIGMFERGSQDTVFIGGEDIGKIFSLTVYRNDQGTAPKWNLAWVSVSRSDDSSERSFFEFNDWIPETSITEKPQKEYNLNVFTSDDPMAGTDANLTFTLRGSSGKSASLTVNTKPKGVCERGATDSFRLTGEDVGDFSSISVYNDGSGNGPKWKVLYIEVSDFEQSHRFLFDKWVGGDETVTVEV